MTAGIILLEDELLSGKNRTLHKIQCSGIGNINFLDLKEAELLTLNTALWWDLSGEFSYLTMSRRNSGKHWQLRFRVHDH